MTPLIKRIITVSLDKDNVSDIQRKMLITSALMLIVLTITTKVIITIMVCNNNPNNIITVMIIMPLVISNSNGNASKESNINIVDNGISASEGIKIT